MGGLSDYDKNHLAEILVGQGTWWTARLLRALNELLPYADREHQGKLLQAFPEETRLILKQWGWSDTAIAVLWGDHEPPMDVDAVYDAMRDEQAELLHDDGYTDDVNDEVYRGG